ncbi:protein MKS1-like [Prosopis cineraria]|uniref:protein MKS1-like n=1 Tax=Prosopis cineraria TaxID=364024 RepID=UPI00240FC7B8|nr:protein MKS1-like [Prosopis cineraria]
MNLPGDSAGGSTPPSSKKQLQLQGPRPPPLRVSKESHIIKKPPLPPHAAAVATHQHPRLSPDDASQQRQPVIIYSVSPKVLRVPVSDFMDVVQRLTGLHSVNEQPSGSGAVSPAAKLASIEKTSPSEKERLRSAGNDAMIELEGIDVGQFPGILSPTPASLGPIPPDYFSPVAETQPFWHDLSIQSFL